MKKWVKRMNREERARIAQSHNKEMLDKYMKEIVECSKNTKIYHDNETNDFNENNSINLANKHKNPVKPIKNEITLLDADTVSAIIEISKQRKNEEKLCALNFASYKHPGGGFLHGSMAQEEALCHESILYNILKSFGSYYNLNSWNLNNNLYTNRALFTSDVLFLRNSMTYFCDVITCAAPNKGAAKFYKGISDEDNSKALKERCKFILDIAVANNVDILILGSFGCGVFEQDPKEVVDTFLELLKNYRFKEVIFAVPSKINDKEDVNYTVFEKEIERYEKKNLL